MDRLVKEDIEKGYKEVVKFYNYLSYRRRSLRFLESKIGRDEYFSIVFEHMLKDLSTKSRYIKFTTYVFNSFRFIGMKHLTKMAAYDKRIKKYGQIQTKDYYFEDFSINESDDLTMLRQYLTTLKERQKDCLLHPTESSLKYGITRQRVYQIRANGIKKFTKFLMENK